MAKTPTIIIGLGSSGYGTIKECQRLYAEAFGSPKPDHVEYIYLETFTGEQDYSYQQDDASLGIKRVYTSLSQMELMIDGVSHYTPESDWLPPKAELVDAGAGAGGIRPCGRLALWGQNDDGDNFSNVVKAIKSAKDNITAADGQDDYEKNPIVFITGTLVGGTGSGMFIDMGYLVKELIKNVKFVFGLFLLPPQPISIRGNEVKYANAYGALRELDLYNSPDYVYKEKYPNGAKVESSQGPFDNAQLISQDSLDGRSSIKNIDGLIKMTGVYMFLNIAGLYNKRRERFVDGKGNFLIGKYGTFGLSAIQYPKDQIQEYIACKLSGDILVRWLDTQYVFINAANRTPINDGEIDLKVEAWINEVLSEAFKLLNAVGGQDLVSQLEQEAKKINSKEITGSEDEYLRNLFSSNTSNKLYVLVKNNMNVAVNFIIDQIYELNTKTLDESENLTYSKKILQAVARHLGLTINYWKKLELSSQEQQWENFLRDQVKWMLKNRNKLIGEQNNTLLDRMKSTFIFMKMHLMGKSLFEIKNYIEKEEAAFVSTSGNKLPRLKDYGNLIDMLGEVEGKRESNYNSIKGRMKEIETDMTDMNVPILKVFATGTFEKDIDFAYTAYNQQNGAVRSKKEVVGEVSLVELFSHEEIQIEIYSILLRSYKNTVNNSGVVGDFDVSQYVKKNPKKGIDIASRSVSPFISTKGMTFQQTDSIPKFVLSSDGNVLSEILKQFSNHSFNEFSDRKDDKLELKDLKNILVFYKEQAIPFVPLKHLSYIEQMEEVYGSIPPLYKDQGMTDKRWVNYRNAYKPIKAKKDE